MKQFLSKYVDIIILLAHPLLLVALNSNWIFPPRGANVEGYAYYAYMRYFYDWAPYFPSNEYYIIERMTWLVPAYYVHRLFPPVIANCVLHLGVYYTAVFSLYGVLCQLFERRTALITALMLGSYSWFLRAAGWDYVDGAGIALILLLLFLLTFVSRSSHMLLFLFLGGMVHAALLITNPFWLGFAPGWSLYFLILSARRINLTVKKLVSWGTIFVSGNLVVAGAASLFFHRITGSYNIIRNSLHFSYVIPNSAANTEVLYKFYGSMPAYWHMLPISLALVAVARLLKGRQSPSRFELMTIVAIFAAMYGWLVFWHVKFIPYLFVFLYSSFIIPATFLLFGCLVSFGLKSFSEAEFIAFIVVSILILAAPFFLSATVPSLDHLQGNIYLIFLGVLVLLIGLISSATKLSMYLIVLGFTTVAYIGGINSYVFFPDRYKNLNNYLIINDFLREMESSFPTHAYTDFRLWFAGDSYLTNFETYHALESFYLFSWGSVIGGPYYEFTEDGIREVPLDHFIWPKKVPVYEGNVVLISEYPNSRKVLAQANEALSRVEPEASLRQRSTQRLQRGDLDMTVIVTRLSYRPVPLVYDQKYDFSRVIGGKWYPQRQVDGGEKIRWSGPDRSSELLFRFPSSNRDIQIQLCAALAIRPDIPRTLKLSVNDIFIPTTLSYTDEECAYLFTGIIPSQIVQKNPVRIVFELDKVLSPQQVGYGADENKIGLAYTWLVIRETK